MVADVDWQHYLHDFHREHAGITEGVLGHAVDCNAATAYDWLAESIPRQPSWIWRAATVPKPHGYRVRIGTFARTDVGRRQHELAKLVAVSDRYTWKVLRHDMGLSAEHTRAAIKELAEAITAGRR